MTYRLPKLAAVAWMLALSPAFADALDDHILAQLSCVKSPDPTYALLALEKTGRINDASATLMDSATCWPITPALELAGQNFSDICASSEDPLMIEQFPTLYWRGPGTSAGTGLALISHAGVDALSVWAKSQFANDTPLYTVDQSYRVDGGTEIGCNSMSFVQ